MSHAIPKSNLDRPWDLAGTSLLPCSGALTRVRDGHFDRVMLDWLRALPRPNLPDGVAALIARDDWSAAHAMATPLQRLTVAIDLMLARGNIARWPKLLALAIAGTSFPRREYKRLTAILRVLHARGLRVFDCDASEATWTALPAEVRVYRGTTLAELESREFGICWSLDVETAKRFATRTAIARLLVEAAGAPDVGAELVPDGFDSEPVVLSATVERRDIAGVLTRLDEREILVRSGSLRDVANFDSWR